MKGQTTTDVRETNIHSKQTLEGRLWEAHKEHARENEENDSSKVEEICQEMVQNATNTTDSHKDRQTDTQGERQHISDKAKREPQCRGNTL